MPITTVFTHSVAYSKIGGDTEFFLKDIFMNTNIIAIIITVLGSVAGIYGVIKSYRKK